MSSESQNSFTDRWGSVTTSICHTDTPGRCVGSRDPTFGLAFAAEGKLIDLAELERGAATAPRAAVGQREPILTHTFEFRLSSSEGAEESLPLPPYGPAPSGFVGITSVRTFLTRHGEAAATSAIGGLEVHAELRQGGIWCTAQLSDFGAGDLVVVQVEVALF
jgi:hypothetical protein